MLRVSERCNQKHVHCTCTQYINEEIGVSATENNPDNITKIACGYCAYARWQTIVPYLEPSRGIVVSDYTALGIFGFGAINLRSLAHHNSGSIHHNSQNPEGRIVNIQLSIEKKKRDLLFNQMVLPVEQERQVSACLTAS